MNLLRTLDVNGGNVNFYFKGNLGPRTILGGILNISLGFVFILLIVGFGRDFYLRINPQSVVQELFLNEYPKYTLTNQNYPLAFRIEDSDALLLDTEHKYFYFSIYQYYYERVDGVMQMVILLITYVLKVTSLTWLFSKITDSITPIASMLTKVSFLKDTGMVALSAQFTWIY